MADDVGTTEPDDGVGLTEPVVSLTAGEDSGGLLSGEVGLVSALDGVLDGVDPAGELEGVELPVGTSEEPGVAEADAVVTADDRVDTGADAVVTADDRVDTGADAVVTADDRVDTGAGSVTVGDATVGTVFVGVSTVTGAWVTTVLGTVSTIVGAVVSVTGSASAGTIPPVTAVSEIAAPEASTTTAPRHLQIRSGAVISSKSSPPRPDLAIRSTYAQQG